MRIFIITEGSDQSGLGHLYRVKSFALKCLKKEHISIKIYTDITKNLLSIFTDFESLLIYKTTNDKLLNLIRRYNPDFIIFDLLKIDEVLFNKIKKLNIKTVSFSPIFNKLQKVDYLFTRGDSNFIKGPKIFSGIEYVLIGNHIKKINEEAYKFNLSENFLPIAITLGGTDASNKTMKIIQSLVKYEKKLQLWVLLGEGYKHSYTQLVKIIKANPLHEIILARTNRSMWNILKNTVLAVTAGGLTAFEAATAGLPTINIVEKELHKNLLYDLLNSKIAYFAGIWSNYNEAILLDLIDELNCNKDQLLNMHVKSKSITNKIGGEMIIKELTNIFNCNEIK